MTVIYLDYNSTTPVDPRVLNRMDEAYRDCFGNPSSTHMTGASARDLVDESRASTSHLLGTDPNNIIFTSGATEANNTVVSWLAPDAKNKRILYGATEHKSIIQPCTYMARNFGLDAVPIPVTKDGIIDTQKYTELLEQTPANVVSVMAANSETGVINPIQELASIAKEHNAVFHCDATQAVGRIPFDMDEMGVDIATISSHKIYGPKGVGALVASRDIRRRMTPMIHGGGQENELRSGTENVPGIAGFAEACDIARTEGLADSARQARLRDHLEEQIVTLLGYGTTVNGKTADRIPNTSSIRIKGALADAVMVNMRKAEISTGSACTSSTMEPSHVLVAMGLSREEADESIRASLGRPTTKDDIDESVQDIVRAARYVREKEALVAEKMA